MLEQLLRSAFERLERLKPIDFGSARTLDRHQCVANGAPRRDGIVLGQQAQECLGALVDPHFTDKELAVIDQYAVEGGINIWSESSANR